VTLREVRCDCERLPRTACLGNITYFKLNPVALAFEVLSSLSIAFLAEKTALQLFSCIQLDLDSSEVE
jgi:hypothetical protein